MKTSLTCITLLAVLSAPLVTIGQSWDDVSLYSSSQRDEIFESVKDKDDNTYWLGIFEGELKIGDVTVKNEDGVNCSVLFKKKSNGDIDWVAQMGMGKTTDGAVAFSMYLNEKTSEIMVTGALANNTNITFTNPKGSDVIAKSTTSDRQFDAIYGLDGEVKSVTVFSSSVQRELWMFDRTSSDMLQTQTIDGELNLSKGPLGGTMTWSTPFKGATEVTDVHIAKDGRIAVVGDFESAVEIGDSSYTATGASNTFIAILDKNGTVLTSDYLEANFVADQEICIEGSAVFLVGFFDRFMRWRGEIKHGGDVTALVHFNIDPKSNLRLQASTTIRSDPFTPEDIQSYGKHVIVAGRAFDYVLHTDGTSDDFQYTNGSADGSLAFYDTTEKKVTSFLMGGADGTAQEKLNTLEILSNGKVLAGGWAFGGDGDITFGSFTLKGKDQQDMVIASTKLTAVGLNEKVQHTTAPTMYPNPAHQSIQFGQDITVEHLKILDTHGRVIQDKASITNQSIDISALPTGVYILEGLSESRTFHVQFIKT